MKSCLVAFSSQNYFLKCLLERHKKSLISGVRIENNYVNCRGKNYTLFSYCNRLKEHSKLHNLASPLKLSLMTRRGIVVIL